MALSHVDVHIQNPAAKPRKKKRNMAKRHLSAKQIRFFGSKRQKAALKAKRKHAPRKKHNTARKHARKSSSSHRPRTKPKAKRRNPVSQIVSWVAGNPARKKGKKKMAHTKKKRKSSARHNAGRSHAKKHYSRRRHRNPAGLGSVKDWVEGGAGVLAGVIGTRALPQMVLGASNAGPMGYGANIITAVGLGWLANMLFKGNKVLVASVIAGGFAATLSRVIADKTPFGAQFSLSGLGDWGLGLYQKSNFNRPQHLVNGRPGTPGSSNFAFGPGSPYSNGLPTLANAGADSTANC